MIGQDEQTAVKNSTDIVQNISLTKPLNESTSFLIFNSHHVFTKKKQNTKSNPFH